MTPQIDFSLVPQTRIHPINLISTYPDAKIWLKREDEAGYAIAGGKKRKFSSLIPYLKAHGYQEVAIVAGANSNHLLASLQLLREADIRTMTFRKAAYQTNLGNGFLTSLLETEETTRIIEGDMQAVHAAAKQYVEATEHKTFLLPEGGFCAPALPGAMTLMDDIVRNETENEVQFDHIFMDSGTGLSAWGLILGNAIQNHPAHIHVVNMAMEETEFRLQSATIEKWNAEMGGSNSTSSEDNYSCYQAVTAGRFGKVNQRIIDAIRHYAQKLGVLTDPVYSAKLFLTAEYLIPKLKLKGNVLIVHSGGAQTLPGFAEKLLADSE
jgi:1-aminocyclopropane-1-carboxylate deaminase/D-cysteine desulfhydrase-like pyridoxal-dependent ACC family enzyme